jgi:peptide/nickel transport system substrate-binding protein
MRTRLAWRAVGVLVAPVLVAAGLTVGAIAPAQSATKSTLTLLSTADITSLNSSTSEGNTAYNATVASLTGMGFSYYNDKTQLVMNTKFGSMKIVKQTPKDFRIQYTVAKGQQWSDGTPIDAVDLLLSHIVASEGYSKDAGLGDPKAADAKPAFDSVGYGGAYGEHVVGLPQLSADKMSLTVRFGKPLPDWELLAPGASPVHALSLMADGKKGLQSAAANLAAKEKFRKAFYNKTTAHLKKIGEIWSTAYNVTKVDSSTNPLLLISNGGFIISKFTAGDSMTLVRNAKYSSGPAMATKNPIKTVVIKIIEDNTAAVQALRNGDIDIYYNTLPSGADRIALEAMPNVTTMTKSGGTYSHLDLRVDSAFGETDSYRGPFAGNGTRAKDLRKAFLLAVPREQMVNTIVKPVQASATTMNTQFAFPGTPEYDKIVKVSGISEFTTGTQEERTKKALEIVKKYYPDASEDNPKVTVKIVHAQSATRVALTRLITAEAKKAGFNVEGTATANWPGDLSNAEFDASMYGWQITSVSQANSTAIYKTDGGNNVSGWSDSALDAILRSLEGDVLTPKQVTAKRIAADKIAVSNYWTLTLYANPVITAYNKDLKGIKPAPIGNPLTWNFFEWSY